MKFNRLYIEEGIVDKLVDEIERLKQYVKRETPVVIRHYKDIFSRYNQDLGQQKKNPSLILAAKGPPYVFHWSRRCSGSESHGSGSYYVLPVMNCIMECEYCFLRGMYPTGNIVYFVNVDEVISGLKHFIHKHNVRYLALTYESDLLVLDQALNCVEPWLRLAREAPGTLFELRTKAGNMGMARLLEESPLENVILAWTISPPEVAAAFEAGAPPFHARLMAMKAAIERGWKVRVCIDPILYVELWEEIYGEAISTMFRKIDPSSIVEAHIGVFRMGKKHLKAARKRYPWSQLLHYPYELVDDTFTYPEDIRMQLIKGVTGVLLDFLPSDKIKHIGGEQWMPA